jgi:hypothetical protein
MKKMNKMYEAPKTEVVELNVNKDYMQFAVGSFDQGDDDL